MNVDEVVQYWLELAEEDWPVAEHLLASGDYHYALFFGHLYLEKLLKGIRSGGRSETGFLVLHKRHSVSCRCFSAAKDVFLGEKPGFLAPM